MTDSGSAPKSGSVDGGTRAGANVVCSFDLSGDLAASLALVLAATALAASPSEAFSRLNTCVPQYAYRVVRDYYGQEKLAKYYRDATCQWTIVSYAPVPHSKIATRR